MSRQSLTDFCTFNDLSQIWHLNTQQNKHIITWNRTRKMKNHSGKIVKIYNQINYIICPRNIKNCLINARYIVESLLIVIAVVITNVDIVKYKI